LSRPDFNREISKINSSVLGQCVTKKPEGNRYNRNNSRFMRANGSERHCKASHFKRSNPNNAHENGSKWHRLRQQLNWGKGSQGSSRYPDCVTETNDETTTWPCRRLNRQKGAYVRSSWSTSFQHLTIRSAVPSRPSRSGSALTSQHTPHFGYFFAKFTFPCSSQRLGTSRTRPCPFKTI